jgi:hypothetical protein
LSSTPTRHSAIKLSVLKVLDNDPINQFENPDQDKEEDQNDLHAEVHGAEEDYEDKEDGEEQEDENGDVVMIPSPPPTITKSSTKLKQRCYKLHSPTCSHGLHKSLQTPDGLHIDSWWTPYGFHIFNEMLQVPNLGICSS